MVKYIHCMILLLLACLPGVAQTGKLNPADLTCEFTRNPLGIGTSTPRFGWTLLSGERNQHQTAFEILVSESLSAIGNFKGEVWTTGQVVGADNRNIDYNGSPLKPFTRYYWVVRTYDNDRRPGAWSSPAWFETAMLNPADWKARWIGDGSRQFERDEDFYGEDRMPLFRKEFTVRKRILQARLYVAGIGYHEAYVNGKKTGDHVLDPGWTPYKKEVLYITHDITASLRQGKNVTAFMLGNGWWNPLPLRLFGRFNLRDVQETGRPCVRAEIHIDYADGSRETIMTDETWQTAPGPVVRNSVYLGEHYDARLEQANWNRAGRVESNWRAAVETTGPSGELYAQMQPPIRTTRIVRPVRISELKPGVFIADMGQNFAGVARINVRGRAGTKITLRYGEALHADGTLNYLTTVAGHIKEMWNLRGGPGAPPTAWQEDSYTLKGDALETWSPRFTFHGFRYVEISGWPGKPAITDIEGLRMNSDLQPAGEFSCSNEMFNQLHQTIQWTFLSNVFSVQSDCPGREKMGYGADIVTTANTFMYNYDMHNFYIKTLRDFANEQQPDGGITEIAPYTGIHDKGVGGESGPLGWQLAFPYLQKQLYEFYGDKKIISTCYPALGRQIAFLRSKAIDGLFHWDISDHVAIDPKPEAFSASAFYYHHVRLAAEFAGILGNQPDSIQYARHAEEIKQMIIAKYYVPGTGRFDNGTQSAQLFALWYDFSGEKDKTMKVLMDEFERHNWHVSSGIFGVMMMFDVLRRTDQPEVAYTIANQRDFPGWGYMLSKGATTLWESWEYPDNAGSQNHPMFASVDEWFYRSLLGINPGAPGFKKIIVKPQPAGDLKWAKGSYQSVAGKIVSDWKIEDGKFRLNVSLPPNTETELWIPATGTGTLTESGVAVGSATSFTLLKFAEGYAVIRLGSGDYSFESDIN